MSKKSTKLETQSTDSSDQTDLSSFDLDRACHTAVLLITPITLCITIVFVTYLKLIYVEKDANYNAIQNSPVNERTFEYLQWSEIVYSVLIFISSIALATFLLFFLFKFEFYNVIFYWLCISTIGLLVFLATFLMARLFKELNCTIDWITIVILTYNNGFVGMLSVFNSNRMPKILNQIYLICIAGLVAVKLLYFFPGFICWAILFTISIWDLFAVLFPKGPLNLMIKIAKERNVPLMPALIYSSILIMLKQDKPDSVPNHNLNEEAIDKLDDINLNSDHESEIRSVKQVKRAQSKDDASKRSARSSGELKNDVKLMKKSPSLIGEHDRTANASPEHSGSRKKSSIKLGLGDFVFYSILVGKSSQTFNFFIVLSTMLSMFVGLQLTLIILVLTKKPMPALPFSIAIGIWVYSTSYCFLTSFQDELNHRTILL